MDDVPEWAPALMVTPSNKCKRVDSSKCHCFSKSFIALYREHCPDDIVVNKCANTNCDQPASEGAHLKIWSQGNYEVFILPMCSQCYDSTDQRFTLSTERYPRCLVLTCCCYNSKKAECQCVPYPRCECRNANNRRCTCSAHQ